MGAYQILYLERVPPSAAVNESVELAKSVGLAHAASYVNAVMRAVHRGGKDLLAVDPSLSPAERISQETSHPIWMVEKWMAQWGEEESKALCRANNEVPPLTLRANGLRISREALALALREEGVQTEPTPYSPVGLRVLRLPVPLESLQSFQQGEFQVQDEAAQLVSLYAAAHLRGTGARVLDACAAPGGKTFHLAELVGPGGEVVAVDVHPRKAEELRGEAERRGLGKRVRVLCADAAKPIPGLSPASFDAVLVDAPCTGLGTLRRHPELKLRRAAEDPARMAEIQRAILLACAPWAKQGAVITYSVCSLTRAEGPAVARAALERGLERAAAPSGFPADVLTGEGDLLTSPSRHGCDGFYAARFVGG